MLREVVLNLEMWIGNNRDNLRQQLLERGERIYDVAHGRNRFFVLSEISYADNYTIYLTFISSAGFIHSIVSFAKVNATMVVAFTYS